MKTAYRKSDRPVSNFLTKYLDEHQHCTWQECKEELRRRFGEALDPQTKLMRLRKYKQKPMQSAQVFAEVLHMRANEIYGDGPAGVDSEIAQRDLVSTYVQGLSSKFVAKKVVALNPRTLADATTLAIQFTEQSVRIHAHGLGEDEAMDVNAIDRRRGPKKTKAQSQFKWKDGKPVCRKCNEVGHMGRECKAPKEKSKVGKGPKKSSEDKNASDSEN